MTELDRRIIQAIERTRARSSGAFNFSEYAEAFGPSALAKADEVAALLRSEQRIEISNGTPVFVSVGGADGTEVVELLNRFGKASRGIIVEKTRHLADIARQKAASLPGGKQIVVIEGDAQEKIEEAIDLAAQFVTQEHGTFVAVTCHAILHELYDRGKATFDPTRFFATIFNARAPAVWFTYREPGVPEEWPIEVSLSAACEADSLLQLSALITERHANLAALEPTAHKIGPRRIRLHKSLAFETMWKLLYVDDLPYEIDERVSAITHSELVDHLNGVLSDWPAGQRQPAKSKTEPSNSMLALWDALSIEAERVEGGRRVLLSYPRSHTRVSAGRIDPAGDRVTLAPHHPQSSSPVPSSPLHVQLQSFPKTLLDEYARISRAVEVDLSCGHTVSAFLMSVNSCPDEGMRVVLKASYQAHLHSLREYAQSGDYASMMQARESVAAAINDEWGRFLSGAKATRPIGPVSLCINNLPADELLEVNARSVECYMKALGGKAKKTLAVVAPSGTGKSSLAMQIARHAALNCIYEEVLWVEMREASTWARFVAAVQEQHSGLDLSQRLDRDAIHAVHNYFGERNLRTLLVLDNLDDAEDQLLKEFVRSAPIGFDILITTTSGSLADALGASVPVGSSLLWDAREFLSLVAWQADSRGVTWVARGARVAIDIVDNGLGEYLKRRDLLTEYSVQDRDLAANVYELCEHTDWNPKLLLYGLADIRRHATLEDFKKTPLRADSIGNSDQTTRWLSVDDGAQAVAALLLPHDEGLHVELLAAVGALDRAVCDSYIQQLLRENLIQMRVCSGGNGYFARLHTIDALIVRREYGADGVWGPEQAGAVLRFFTTCPPQSEQFRLSHRILKRAIICLEGREDVEKRGIAVLSLAEGLKRAGLWQTVLDLGEVCMREANAINVKSLANRIALDMIAWVMFWRKQFRQCLRVLDQIQMVDQGDQRHAQILRRRAHCLIYTGDVMEARRILEQLINDPSAKESVDARINTLIVFAQLEIAEKRFEAAIDLTKEARALAQSRAAEDDNMAKEESVALYYQAEAERLSGKPEDALGTALEANAITEQLRRIPGLAHEMLCIAECERELGFPAGLQRTIRRLSEAQFLFDRLGDEVHVRRAASLLARLRLRAGR